MTTLKRNKEQDFVITVTDGAGNAVPLTGFTAATFKMARKRGSAALVTKTLGSGTAITDAAGGEITASLTDADTDRLGTFYWHCDVADASGNDSTPADGYLTIEATTV